MGDELTGTYGTDWIMYGLNAATQGYFALGAMAPLEVGRGY
ncbi:MAG: hypothetical protein R3F37_10380 [Candidatus Competibacteraceae bacterium]